MNTVVSQGLATGLPVVTTDHSGLPEQVLDGKNGFVVPEGDCEALAAGILFLMEHQELWARFGRFGRAHVTANYDSQSLMVKQIEYYADLIARPLAP